MSVPLFLTVSRYMSLYFPIPVYLFHFGGILCSIFSSPHYSFSPCLSLSNPLSEWITLPVLGSSFFTPNPGVGPQRITCPFFPVDKVSLRYSQPFLPAQSSSLGLRCTPWTFRGKYGVLWAHTRIAWSISGFCELPSLVTMFQSSIILWGCLCLVWQQFRWKTLECPIPRNALFPLTLSFLAFLPFHSQQEDCSSFHVTSLWLQSTFGQWTVTSPLQTSKS